MFLHSACIFYLSLSSTSFGVNGTRVRVVFVAIFTISVDPPRLTKSLRTRLNKARAGQEVVPLVTIVVTTQTTSLPGPSRPQLREREEVTGVVVRFPMVLQSFYIWNAFTFKRTRPRPSQSKRRSSLNLRRTDECTDLWICRWPVMMQAKTMIKCESITSEIKVFSKICANVLQMFLVEK